MCNWSLNDFSRSPVSYCQILITYLNSPYSKVLGDKFSRLFLKY